MFKALSSNFPWTNKAELDLVFDILEEKGYDLRELAKLKKELLQPSTTK